MIKKYDIIDYIVIENIDQIYINYLNDIFNIDKEWKVYYI